MQHFDSDYMEGAHPLILERLVAHNMVKTTGYGCDDICAEARKKILAACGNPDSEVHFLVGGTQTNATIIKALLRPHEGVILPNRRAVSRASSSRTGITSSRSAVSSISGMKFAPMP